MFNNVKWKNVERTGKTTWIMSFFLLHRHWMSKNVIVINGGSVENTAAAMWFRLTNIRRVAEWELNSRSSGHWTMAYKNNALFILPSSITLTYFHFISMQNQNFQFNSMIHQDL
jgi:hypothetical protein